MDAILHPEEVDEKVETVVGRIREQAEAARENVSVLGTPDDLNPGEAQCSSLGGGTVVRFP